MPNLRCTVNFQPQLTVDSKDQPVPLSFLTQYSQKAMIDLAFPAAQVNYPINAGTLDKPAVILVVCEEGEFNIAFDVAGVPGTGQLKLNANTIPAPTYLPFHLYFTNDPTVNKLYISTPGVARGRVWIFQ
jgi:hypothetical protein